MLNALSERMPISLRQKLKALKEVENIYRLSKKALPPQGTTWARVADKVLRKALGEPIEEAPESLNITEDKQMHQHSPRTARIVERTLRNGTVHPDVLHSYRDGTTRGTRKAYFSKPTPTADTPDVIHYVQHGSADLTYPHGHMQGYGFVPSEHATASHVQLEGSVRPATDAVPTKGSAAAGDAYH